MVRRNIDGALEQALGLPPLVGISRLLASEPVISGQPLLPPSPTAQDIDEEEDQLTFL